MQIQICQKNPKKKSPHRALSLLCSFGCGSTAKREFCRAKFSSGIQKSMDGFLVPYFRQCKFKFVRKIQKNSSHRALSLLCSFGCGGTGKNFAEQNSRQESENPRMDFRFLKLRKSLLYKKNPPSRGTP